MKIGYCTNVHAGVTLSQVQQNLDQFAVEIRDLVSPEHDLPVGLWLSDPVSRELEDSHAVADFADWLVSRRLLPYTLNGFPFSDFHQPVVKHEVYQPTWDQPARYQYTLRLARILAALIPAGELGTISTLPVAWPLAGRNRAASRFAERFSTADQARMVTAGNQLKQLALQLAELKEQTGRLIRINLEPEPGCLLDSAEDVIAFFESCLWDQPEAEAACRTHLSVCHDICHSAVMFESQEQAIAAYRSRGIRIGKIQVSSAVEADFSSSEVASVTRLELETFAEPRYLHQTVIQRTTSHRPTEPNWEFFEDLPLALARYPDDSGSRWRVHFHVPIFLDKVGALGTTQREITTCLRALQSSGELPPLEVETYAWNVLPNHDPDSLAAGIAQEIAWLSDAIQDTSDDA